MKPNIERFIELVVTLTCIESKLSAIKIHDVRTVEYLFIARRLRLRLMAVVDRITQGNAGTNPSVRTSFEIEGELDADSVEIFLEHANFLVLGINSAIGD